MDESVRESLRDVLAHAPQVSLAYLFGSRVDGSVGPLSDYGLGVLVVRGQDAPEMHTGLYMELGRLAGEDRVDLVLLNRTPIELAFAVISQGEVLYDRDTATRVEYEAQVMSLYGDHRYGAQHMEAEEVCVRKPLDSLTGGLRGNPP